MTVIVPLLFLMLVILGAPLFSVIGASAMFGFAGQGTDLSIVAIEFFGLAETPVLVAIPLFTFAGYLLSHGGAPGRLVRLSEASLGWLSGGLAIVSLAACALFTAFTGASGVTIIALGTVLFPALVASGYSQRFSLGLITTSGSLGLLFAPSLPLILYGIVAEVAIDDLFLAGIIPGTLMVLALSVYSYAMNRRGVTGLDRGSWADLKAALIDARYELPLPPVVLGGIYSGAVTVTEAASITAFYALLAEVVIYRNVSLRQIPGIVRSSMVLVAGILVILAAAFGFTNYLVDAEVPMRILEWMQGAFSSKWTFLLALNVFLLIVGSLMDIFSALIVVVPLILPIAEGYGVNLTHLGIIFLTNLEIGYSTPPVGLNLFISSFRFDRTIVALYRACLPFLGILLLALAIITYVPWLSLFLADLVRGGVAP